MLRALLFLLAAAQAPDQVVLPGDAFLGRIAFFGDADLVELAAIAGMKLTVTCAAVPKSAVLPKVEIIDPSSGDVLNGGKLLKGLGKKSVRSSNIVFPTTGTCRIRISSVSGSTGDYKLKVTASFPPALKSVKTTATIAAAATADVPFLALPGSVLSGTILPASKSPALPQVMAL